MNKTQLVDALAERLGDRRTAAAAVEGLLETIVDTVRSGQTVTITGFGVFEGRARAARTARNPRTGATVAVPATTVPAFRPGMGFRSAVATAAGANGSAAAAAPATPAAEAPAKATKRAKTTKPAAKSAAKPEAKSDAKPKAARGGKKNQDKPAKDKKPKSKK
jgi:DNA-binding protein HU-beta